jgi:hypothetical protein
MKKTRLRIFDDSLQSSPAPQEPTVRLRLRDVFPLLVHAHHCNYQWLHDLADDELVVTHDLADILRTFDAILQQKRGA